jgi:hypothetical protein
VTPARNEARFIESTIQSVVAQTSRPLRWVIVSDGSTDGTDEIVSRYADLHDWIELLRMPERKERHFAGKAYAFRAGKGRTDDLSYDVIASLDADITFDSEYFSFLLGKLAVDPALGVVGTPYEEKSGEIFDYRFTSLDHVSGACQVFRRECYEAIGGLHCRNLRADEGVEDPHVHRQGVPAPSHHGHSTGQSGEGELQHRSDGLRNGKPPIVAVVSSGVSDNQEAVHFQGTCTGDGLSLVISPARGKASDARICKVPSARTDGQTQKQTFVEVPRPEQRRAGAQRGAGKQLSHIQAASEFAPNEAGKQDYGAGSHDEHFSAGKFGVE